MKHPHPEISIAQAEQGVLRPLYPGQGLPGKGFPGGNPGGQAGIGRLIPGKKARLPGQAAYVRLGQAALPQGGAHLQLPQSPHARSVAGLVGGVGAVQQDGVPVGRGPRLQRAEQVLLAVVAPLRRVGRHPGVGQGVQLQHHHLHPQLPGQPEGVVPLKPGLEGGLDVVGADIRPGPHPGVQQIGRVHPAGKAQGALGVGREKLVQRHGPAPHTSKRL